MTAPRNTSSHNSLSKTRGHGKHNAQDVIKSGKAKEFARKEVEKEFEGSSIADHVQDYPKFDIAELSFGKILGKGGFGTVSEIRAFQVDGVKVKQKKTEKRNYSNALIDLSSNGQSGRRRGGDEMSESGYEAAESRLFIAQNCLRNNSDARYAVKLLSSEIVADPSSFLPGMIDIALETRFLSDIEHPNIVKLRAVAHCGPFNEEYFLVMDRLYDTLERRIQKRWLSKHQSQTSFFGKKILDRKGKKRDALYEERIVCAYDLASAINYLHKRSIIYRDIKPENIGFDVRNDIKLFDFGLAKELREHLKVDGHLYKLTADTGSPRYMAPEVALGKPYNATCDSYSFSLLLWQMVALKTPFEVYTVRKLKELVWSDTAKRPPIDEHWPTKVKLLMKKGWSQDWTNRFTMDQVEELLRKECVRVRDGNDEGLEHTRRRSTFVFKAKN